MSQFLRKFISGSLGAGALCFAACTENSFQNSPGGTEAILAGTEVSVDSDIAKQTVLIWRLIPDEVLGLVSERCTGTLVAPDVVLTAAHCADQNNSVKIYVSFGPVPETTIESEIPTHATAVAQVFIHPHGSHHDDLKRVDLALIQLERPAPGDFQIARLKMDALDPETEAPVVTAGFGKTIGGLIENEDAVQLREVSVRLVNQKSLTLIRKFFLDSLPRATGEREAELLYAANKLLKVELDATYLWVDNRNGIGPCGGDSGGPLLVRRNDQLLQAGVANFGIQDSPLRLCKVATAYTPLSKHRVWLEKTLAGLEQGDR